MDLPSRCARYILRGTFGDEQRSGRGQRRPRRADDENNESDFDDDDAGGGADDDASADETAESAPQPSKPK